MVTDERGLLSKELAGSGLLDIANKNSPAKLALALTNIASLESKTVYSGIQF
jgi:hypothetical protein